MEEMPRTKLAIPIALFVVLTILLAVTGRVYYAQSERQVETAAAGKLDAVADLKVKIISDWRQERIRDAAIISANPMNALRIVPYLKNGPKAAGEEAEVKAWLDSIVAAKKYVSAVLFDGTGRARLASGSGKADAGANAREMLDVVLSAGRPFLSDFHSSPDIGLKIHLDLWAPIPGFDQAGNPAYSGAFLFRVDPADFLYPLLRSWPIPSESAESFLVRRAGDDVLFLSDLRYRPDTALKLRVPATESMIAAALSGPTSVPSTGNDYRGVQTLSVTQLIPDTPWILIAKEDLAEILKPILSRISTFVSMIFVLYFGIAAMILFWIKRQEARFFKRQYIIEHDRLALIQHFEYLHKYANDVVFLTDRNHQVIEANDRVQAVYGLSHDEIIGRRASDLRPPETRADFERQILEAQASGSLIFETLHQRKNGEVFPVEVSLRLIDIGGARYHQAIIRDISERKKAEKRIWEGVREKEVLLREIHHRVKNNMQVISSLLRMQSSKFQDPEVREAFRESQGRIKSMALVHEKLYGTKDLSRIDFADYVRSLTSSVFGSNETEVGRISLTLDLEKTFFDINAAVPCGLILNELILNALKHAFPNNRRGKIMIELRNNENGMIQLTVRDDGIGLSEKIKFGETESLGFQIVSLLVRQLDGRIDIRRESGTTITLRFKTPTYADRI